MYKEKKYLENSHKICIKLGLLLEAIQIMHNIVALEFRHVVDDSLDGTKNTFIFAYSFHCKIGR